MVMMILLFLPSHVIHEVHISEVPTSFNFHEGDMPLLGQPLDLHHHIPPSLMLQRNYHLVYVQESYVLVPVDVSVEAVIVGNDLILPLVRPLILEEHVLENRKVR